MILRIFRNGHEIDTLEGTRMELYNMLDDLREEYYVDAFNEFLDEKNQFVKINSKLYKPSLVLENCDWGEYRARFKEFFDYTVKSLWDARKDGGYITIGNMELKLEEGGE